MVGRPKGSSGTKQLSRDQRLRVRTLYYDGKYNKAEIERITRYSKAQVKKAIATEESDEPSKRGRPRSLTQAQEEELVEFITTSKENRRMGFLQLSVVLFAGIFGVWAIKNTLYRLGFRRRVARKKPPITEKNRLARLAWAINHLNWTSEEWAKILWTDETWVTGGPHKKQFVTRRVGEEWDPTCIVERYQRKRGWMFWGCFSGRGKGPGIFWEKD